MKTLLHILLLIPFLTAAQEKIISLEECYSRARQNYPLVRQKELISKSKSYSLQNASTGRLPQVGIYGQATYQSDVTSLPIQLPNVEMPSISKDQYKIYGEVTQTLFDGGTIKLQKQLLEANSEIEEQKVEVELYKIKDRINQLYFGVLMIEEQLAQIEIPKKDIQAGIIKTTAAIANGISLKSSSEVLQAELLRLNQRSIELQAGKRAYLDMLGLFLNEELPVATYLQKPEPIAIANNISRPELQLFQAQENLIYMQEKSLRVRNLPRLGLFLQAGYGRPALNFLNNDFDSYYIGGIRFNWSLSGLYTTSREKGLLAINRTAVHVQKEAFLFNTNYTVRQQKNEISKLEQLIQSDAEIIALRTRIKNSALAQLENGVITSNDYLREINAEDQARQNQSLHELQLLMAQHNLQFTTQN